MDSLEESSRTRRFQANRIIERGVMDKFHYRSLRNAFIIVPECEALRNGHIWAICHAIKRLRAKEDVNVLIDIINISIKISANIFMFMHNIWFIISKFELLTHRYAFKEANRIVDSIVHLSYNTDNEYLYTYTHT